MIVYWIFACFIAGITAQLCGQGPCAGQQFGAYIPDPKNCSRFYQCTSANETLMECAPGTIFSSVYKVCVHPLQANCTLGSGEEPSLPCPTQPTSQTTLSTPGGGGVVTPSPPVTDTTPPWTPIVPPCSSHEPEFIPNEDCTSYIYCCVGIPVPMQCKDGEYFSVEDRMCIKSCGCPQTTPPTATPPITAPTIGTPSPTPGTETPTPTITIPTEPTEPTTPTTPSIQYPCTGLEAETIGDPDDCTQFTYCYLGVPSIVKCPIGEYYSKDDNVCIEANECPGDGGSKPVVVPPCTSMDPEIHGDPDDCGRYTYCENGIPHIAQCAIGEYFSEEERACIQAAECPSGSGVTLPCTSDEVEIIEIPDDCTKYIYCSNGNPFTVQCPYGEYFSKEHQGCIKADTCPGNGSGTSSTTAQSTTTTTTEKPIKPPCSSLESETVEYPEDCSKFIYCYQGNPYTIQCDPGTYYSKEHDGCIFASECPSGGGSGSTTPTTTITTTTKPPVVAPCTSDNPEVHGNPNDCSQYFYCYEGSPYVVQCKLGSYFSEEYKKCIEADQCPADVQTTTETTTSEITTSGSTITTGVPIIPPCTSLDPEVWGDPDDCGYYTYCYLGMPYVVKCAIGEYFSEEYGVCIETSECPGSGATTPKPTPSTAGTQPPTPTITIPTAGTPSQTPSITTPTTVTASPTPPITIPTAGTPSPTSGTQTPTPTITIPTTGTPTQTPSITTPTTVTASPTPPITIPTAGTPSPTSGTQTPTPTITIPTAGTPSQTPSITTPTTVTASPTPPVTIPTAGSPSPTSGTQTPTSSPTDTTPPWTPIIPPCSSHEPEFIPNEDCTSYIYCCVGIPVPMQCKDGEYFSVVDRMCIKSSECPQTTSTTATSPITTPSTGTPSPTPGTQTPTPTITIPTAPTAGTPSPTPPATTPTTVTPSPTPPITTPTTGTPSPTPGTQTPTPTITIPTAPTAGTPSPSPPATTPTTVTPSPTPPITTPTTGTPSPTPGTQTPTPTITIPTAPTAGTPSPTPPATTPTTVTPSPTTGTQTPTPTITIPTAPTAGTPSPTPPVTTPTTVTPSPTSPITTPTTGTPSPTPGTQTPTPTITIPTAPTAGTPSPTPSATTPTTVTPSPTSPITTPTTGTPSPTTGTQTPTPTITIPTAPTAGTPSPTPPVTTPTTVIPSPTSPITTPTTGTPLPTPGTQTPAPTITIPTAPTAGTPSPTPPATTPTTVTPSPTPPITTPTTGTPSPTTGTQTPTPTITIPTAPTAGTPSATTPTTVAPSPTPPITTPTTGTPSPTPGTQTPTPTATIPTEPTTPTTPSIQYPCTGLEAETIGDPNDCTQFTYCYLGVPSIVKCPIGEYYSKEDNACIEADECPGDGGSKPVVPPCTSMDPEIHGDPNDCGRYTYCENGIPHIVQCAIGEFFSEEERACIQAAECPSGSGVTPPCTSDEVEIIEIPDDCTKYIYCSNGNPFTVQCPNGEYFSKEHQGCIKANTCPGNGGGSSSTTTQSTTTTTTEKPITPPCSSLESETVEYPEDCSKFIYCYQGNPYTIQCDPGTYYSKEHDGCIFASECPSGGGSGSTTPTTTTTKPPITAPCTSDNPEVHGDPDDCTQYFYCYQGSPYVVQCQLGSYFSEEYKKCIEADQCPADVQTTTKHATSEITTSGSTITTALPIIPPCTSLDPEVWGDPDDCGYYTYCYLGMPYVVKCAIGEYFSEEYGVCIESSECPGSGATTSKTTPSTATPTMTTPTADTPSPTPPTTDTTPPWTPIVPPCSSHEPEFIPNEDDCTRFIYCCVGIPVPMQCSDGEYFSVDDRECIKSSECPQGVTTVRPTKPTAAPTIEPTTAPTTQQTSAPTTQPTTTPTTEPTTIPTTEPTTIPTTQPATIPTTQPTTIPTTQPTTIPTTQPTTIPTTQPTTVPTTEPTTVPTTEPTTIPTTEPTTPHLVPPCTSLDIETYPVSDSCMRYIYCVYGIPYTVQCANGQFYSQEANSCIQTDKCPQ